MDGDTYRGGPADARAAAADAQMRRLIFDQRPSNDLQRLVAQGIAEDVAEHEDLTRAEALVAGAAANATSLLTGGGNSDNSDIERAFALASDPAMRLGHRRSALRSAILKGIRMYDDLQRRGHFPEHLRPFAEDECLNWLLRRFSAPGRVCPRCGHHRGDHLPSRKVWQCRSCGKQLGWRVGTVMEGSGVALGCWFLLIKVLVGNPEFSATEFAKSLQMRPQTVKDMRRRILAALDDPAQRHRLIGLDQLFAPHLSGSSSLQDAIAPEPRRTPKKIQLSVPEGSALPESSVSHEIPQQL